MIRITTKFLIIIFLFIFFLLIFLKNISHFLEAYEIGYNCAQDEFCYFGEYTEAGFQYWESNSFWIEQGYEEGYKKGIRDFWKIGR